MALAVFGGSKITADDDRSHEIKRCLLLGRKVMTNLDSILKSRDITLPTKVHLVRAMRRSNQSILKEISPGISLEGMMLKLKLQYFGHLMRRVDSLQKDSDVGRDWGQEEKGMTEDEMAGWHH